ncbi:Putative KHG/KDPG aldolase [Limihaloglobus sulfuriphilus]|uniref:2-dehydro-3-deoxy-phosphogluconate aldolase n=1 Tax=Limihaloglobus sulfuriphilus TaxID=1851148 RepID=A0A1Q2MAS3_9BACT|nr:bifunctional 4-hydroxy-2-oxoglutarate aldolase/2-dehydro-3-deoxy-phosphogluconate aldolase [Limihaloglobus sulfuriphilus]AQQ69786.1 Putative KHG/KDPG aldolase [Limihaloglobus sulfuriphilus]
MSDVFKEISECRIVATVVVEQADQAHILAQNLLDCGIKCIELTLRTENALSAIETVSRNYPEILVGAGTVLTCEQVERVCQAGARFAVAPGLNPAVVERASQANLPFAPGVCTPSDIEKAVELGCRYLKFFPAEPLGGIKYLKCMAAPYMHKGLRFMPLGGIKDENFMDYLKEDIVFAVGGSWLAPSSLISAGNWEGIKTRCLNAVEKIRNCSSVNGD